MYCPKCGIELKRQSNFCANCGQNLQSLFNEGVEPLSKPTDVDYRSQPQKTEIEYAGFWRRLAALFIDNIMLSIIGFVYGFFFFTFLIKTEPEVLIVLYYIWGILITWLYYSILESSNEQATIGKKTMGIIVVDLSGKKVSFARASGRYFSKYFSILTIGIGYLMIAFSTKKQALHDKISDCLVIKKSSSYKPIKKKNNKKQKLKVICSIIFIIPGIVFLFYNLRLCDFRSFILPLILVSVGIYIAFSWTQKT